MNILFLQTLGGLFGLLGLIAIIINIYKAGWTSGYIKGVAHAKGNRSTDALTAYEKRWEG